MEIFQWKHIVKKQFKDCVWYRLDCIAISKWLNIMYQCVTGFELKFSISASLGVYFMVLSGLYYGWCQQTYLKWQNFNGYSGKNTSKYLRGELNVLDHNKSSK